MTQKSGIIVMMSSEASDRNASAKTTLLGGVWSVDHRHQAEAP